MEVSTPIQPSGNSTFERIISTNPPVLRSLIAQLPTASILSLCQSSSFLRNFFRQSPTSWRYISWRLHQPAVFPVPTVNGNPNAQPRQSSNYALDQLLMYVIIPFSTRLTSLELDNTAVSGATLFQTVMVLRKETLEHVSVRGCKNVSLKYHINPWLMMHAMALDYPPDSRPAELHKLALKSLYTYRCRHHRRRPYLPSSLARKESDSEPTHELVATCHKLGIWTDTAWCTTPGARCYRRRGYVTMRVPQDPREVWVVFDRLWRSRNWLGPPPETGAYRGRKRKRNGILWEQDEDAVNGESVQPGAEGKDTPAHLRRSHKQFIENVVCDQCEAPILERCEQCSVMMHCSGCRKTLCASCAFDRAYLRNKNATEEESQRFWWAPGCAVSPCSMQDIDPATAGAPNSPSTLPNIKFKWCCTEPVFSGGGGITLGPGQNSDIDRIRAAPLVAGLGYEDPEFSFHEELPQQEMLGVPLSRFSADKLGGRWSSIQDLFQNEPPRLYQEVDSAPRVLCKDCYSSDQWKVKCKACGLALCLKHDLREKQRVRVCGYRDLAVEKQEWTSQVKATRVLKTLWLRHKQLKKQQEALRYDQSPGAVEEIVASNIQITHVEKILSGNSVHASSEADIDNPGSKSATRERAARGWFDQLSSTLNPHDRPASPGSNSTETVSRGSSPAPSARSVSATPEPSKATNQMNGLQFVAPAWKGCQSFFCSAGRTAGDHRRRCSATMRQCMDCKIHVCDDCYSGLDSSCPCKGCKLPDSEIDLTTGSTAAFFCPKCRHSRSLSGKCKRPLLALANTPQASRKGKKHRQKMGDIEKSNHIANLLHPQAPSEQPGDLDYVLSEFFSSMEIGGVDMSHDETPNLQELHEMGETARDLVRRIQSFRQQAGPGSVVASALPNIIIEGAETAGTESND